MRKLILLAGMLAIALFHACRKENATQQQPDAAVTKTIATVNAWLDAQLSRTNVQRNERIGQLRRNLDLDRLRLEELNQGERFIIVPVRDGFDIYHNKDKKSVTQLLLILDKTGTVRKGEIVQYIPDDPAIVSLPVNTFHALFNSKTVTADGRFVFLSLFDRHLYELGYKDGAMTAFTVMQPKNKEASRDGDNCINWYLVTTTYYSDGTHQTTQEYIGTTCSGSCQPGERCDHLEGEGGGGGGDDASEIETVVEDWQVAESPSGFWFVISLEEFKGVKIPSRNDGGYFTAMTHKGSDISAVSNDYAWQEYVGSVTFNQADAQSVVSGKVIYNGPLGGHRYIPPTPHAFSVRKVFYK